MSETLSKQFDAHIGSRISYKLKKEGYFDKTGSVIITEDGQVIDLTDSEFIPYDSNLKVVYNPQKTVTVTTATDYTKVGNVTVSDNGIASGFSAEDYILFNGNVKAINTTLYLAFTTPDVSQSDMYLIDGNYWLGIVLKSGFKLCSFSRVENKLEELAILEPNKKYYFKINIANGNTKSHFICDEENTDWIELKSFNDINIDSTPWPTQLFVGTSSSYTNTFEGTIDLSQTFITNGNDLTDNISEIAYAPFTISVDSSDLVCAPSTTLLSTYQLKDNSLVHYYDIADETETKDAEIYAVGLTYKKRHETKVDKPDEAEKGNFAQMGNISIINKVASGFDYDDFLTIDNNKFEEYANLASSWEWNFKFNFKRPALSNANGGMQVLFAEGISYECALGTIGNNLYFNPNNNAGGSSYNITGMTGNTKLEEGKTYWAKAEFTGTEYRLWLSENGIDYMLEGETVSSAKLNRGINTQWTIGYNEGTNQQYNYPFEGSIYLDECYILLNRKIWWKAYDSIDVKALREKQKFYNYILSNGIVTGTTKQISHTISNFSGSNYLELPERFNPGTNSWEIKFRFYTGSNLTSHANYIFGCTNGDAGFLFDIETDRYGYLWLSSNGSSWNIASATGGNYKFEHNTWYYVRLVFTGSSYYVYASTDNNSWTTACSVSSSTAIHPCIIYAGAAWDKSTHYFYTGGVFDLSQLKIFVGGVSKWEAEFDKVPLSDVPTPVVIDNENFFKMGSVIVDSNGIASNFSSTNMIIPNKMITFGSQDSIDINFKITTGSSITGIQEIFALFSTPLLIRVNSSRFELCNHYANEWYNNTSSNITANTTYYIRYRYYPTNTYADGLSYTGKDFYLEYSTDGSSWTRITRDPGNYFYNFFNNGSGVSIGTQGNGEPFLGTIDLKNSYIKKNGEYLWRPYETEDQGVATLHTKYIVQKKTGNENKTAYTNYKIFGNIITTADNVMYNFSDSNYITMNIGKSFVNTADIITRVKIPSYKAGNDICCFGTQGRPFGFGADGKLGRYNGSEWTYGTTIYPKDTWIWVRQIKSNNVYTIYGLIDDNYTLDALPDISEWTTETTWTTNERLFNNVLCFGKSYNVTGEAFTGSIDFNNLKIVIDNEEYPLIIYETRNYTTYNNSGELNISNKLATGFNTNNYIYGNIGILDLQKPWMIQTKVKFTGTSPAQQYIIYMAGGYLQFINHSSHQFILRTYDTAGAFIDSYVGSWTENEWYWIRISFTMNVYKVQISRDGSQYIDVYHNMQIRRIDINSPYLYLGGYSGTSSYMGRAALLDLSETFVTNNGKLVWTAYPDNKFTKYEYKGFYTSDFDYTGSTISVNAYKNTLQDNTMETVLGQTPETDVKAADLLKSNISIGAADETIFAYDSNNEAFVPTGYYKIKFVSNYDDYDITVTGNDKVFTNPNKIYVKPGTKINYKASKRGYFDLEEENLQINQDNQEIELFFDKKEFKFTIDTRKGSSTSDTTYIIPLVYNPEYIQYNDNIVVNWGDETQSVIGPNWSATAITHTYPRAGEFQITLTTESGYMPRFYNYNVTTNNNTYKLISLDSPMLKLTYGASSFQNAYNLKHIHKNLLKYTPSLTSAYYMFYNCQRLKEIPEDLFKYNKKLIDVSYAFYNGYTLEEIPENLFKYNGRLQNINYTFSRCSALVKIYSNLFKYNRAIISFTSTFSSCTSLKEIPEDLFKYNIGALSFNSTFSGCTVLETIPDNLFKYNLSAYSFASTFLNCNAVEINPNIFGEDLTNRFTKVNYWQMNFGSMFMRRTFTGNKCGTAPELWKCIFKRYDGPTLTAVSSNCFGQDYATAGYDYLTYYGNRFLTNFWDIPITWGGVSNIDLTINVQTGE